MSDDAGARVEKLTLIGSGEFLEPMAKVHRTLLEPYGTGVEAAFLDTPAGFELNCGDIAERAIQYFSQRFAVPLGVASYRSPRVSPPEMAAALRRIGSADYLVAGPGSPTYAIRTWRQSAVWDAILARFRAGTHLVFASAAAISLGRRAIPVYEIYRCGDEPRWEDGLDILGPLGIDVAVMPHWNNNSGAGFDSRFCFMGADRRRELEAMLPPSAVILGIDEHTACTLDFGSATGRVAGSGAVTIIRAGSETRHETGTSFPLAELRSSASPPAETPPAAPPSSSEMPGYVAELATNPGLAGIIHETIHELVGATDAPAGPDPAPLLDLLQRAREELRAARRFELSDEIRDRLAEMGRQAQDGSIPA